jgi:enamine deaminase RidA (YjgF/YER057c/UK114 family)
LQGIGGSISVGREPLASDPRRTIRMNAEARIAELKLELPAAPKPVATYVPVVQVGNLVYVSGHGPLRPDKTLVTGVVGTDLTEEQGYESARVTGLAILATLRNYLGSLDRVVRLVKVLGMVNAAPSFERHPFVINGFSDLMVEVFGEPGKGARSAVGMGSLPGRIATEVEAIFEVRDAAPPRAARRTKKPAAKAAKRVAKKKRK